MALPSSGQISVSDILTELGLDASNPDTSFRSLHDGSLGTINTANAAADRPDGAAPHAMSEFYSYNHNLSSWNNDHALDFDGVNDYVTFTPNAPRDFPNDTMTLSFWVRVDQSTKSNMIFYCTTHTDGSSADGRLIIFYHGSLNRLIVQFFKTVSGSNKVYQRQYPLHSNTSQTGITNSSTGWTTGQRGNVDSDNYTHIAVAIDRTNTTVTSGIKAYWNANELTSAVNNTSTMTTSHTFDPNFGAIGEGAHTASKPGASIHDGVLDEMYLYSAQLSSSNISTIYGYGRNTENTFTTNYATAWRFENSVDDEEGLTDTTNNGATFISV